MTPEPIIYFPNSNKDHFIIRPVPNSQSYWDSFPIFRMITVNSSLNIYIVHVSHANNFYIALVPLFRCSKHLFSGP